MKWINKSRLLYKKIGPSGEITRFDGACNHNTIVTNRRYLQTQSGYPSPRILQQASSGVCTTSIQERLPSRNVRGLHSSWKESLLSGKCIPYTMSRRYGHSQSAPHLSRDWLVKLWAVEKEMRISKHKRSQRVVNHPHSSGSTFETQPTFKLPYSRWFSGSVAEERSNDEVKPVRKQPPISQSTIGLLKPTSSEELKVAPLLARSNLLITRDIEWANLVLGFEQENRYAIVDACYPESPAGYIREQSNLIARQILRTRRPFVASITDAMGNELFKIRRPFWWINSTIYAEIDGKEIGVVHRRWHLWRRIYDLYLGNMQFAVVENPGFWNWTFTLKDIDGNVLAEVDRDWRGFGFELLTDAGQYVIRFGQANSESKTGAATAITELETARPLTLSERAVAVALAVSLDNDYFSRHGGWGLPFVAIGE